MSANKDCLANVVFLTRDGMRSSPFLVTRGPKPFLLKELVLSLLGSSRTSKIGNLALFKEFTTFSTYL